MAADDLVTSRATVEDPRWLLTVTAVPAWPLTAHGQPRDWPEGRTIGDWLTGATPPGLLVTAFRGCAPPEIAPDLAALVVDDLVARHWDAARALTIVDQLAACAIRATLRPVEFGFQLGPGPAPQFFLRFAPPAALHPRSGMARPVGPFTVRDGRVVLRQVGPEARIIGVGGSQDGK